LGAHVVGFALPHPDPVDPHTTLAGVAKRFAVAPPAADAELLLEFRGFVRAWIRKHLKPLPADSDTSVDSWLEQTSYPQHRKEELKKKWEAVSSDSVAFDKRKKKYSYHRCKSFMKDETYVEYKHARSINSRSDEFKCLVGPIFRLIEKEVFKLKYFIKKIPVADRPEYIRRMFQTADGVYSASDYTTFEASFEAEIMESCEFELYDYMTSNLIEHQVFMDVMHEVLAGENLCVFKNFSITTLAKRMSGEMCTSLGNGFSNLMFMKFACFKFGSKLRCVVEGDDSLGQIFGNKPTTEFFARLGLTIKLEHFSNLEEASFCGIVFDSVDCINITDPRKVLAGFGWTTHQYANARSSKLRALLRAKALSTAYQYPGCPILASMARWVMRCTRGVDVRHIVDNCRNTYEREKLQEAIRHPIAFRSTPINTRLLVEKLYSVSVEHQIEIEKYFDGLNEITPINHDLVLMNMKPVWSHYWENYVVEPSKDLLHPHNIWTQKPEFRITNPLSVT
jgi:hypothetical protein